MKIELDQSPPTHFDFLIFWNNLPFLFKTLLPPTYILAIIGMFTNLPTFLLSNYAIRSLLHGQVWRLLTSPYVSLGMLHYTICMINLYYILPRIERTYSTAFVLVDFLVQNLMIQVVFTLVVGVAHDFTNYVEDFSSAGLWNILILYLVRVCYAQPQEEIQLCCMPFKLRTVYYPFMMLVVYNVFTLPMVQVDIYVAFVWALLQARCARGNFFKYPPWFLLKIETKLLRLLKNRTDICKLEDSSYGSYYSCEAEEGNAGTEASLKDIKEPSEVGEDKGGEELSESVCDGTI